MSRLLHVPAVVHGRVLLDLPESPTALVVGCHGYGETADDHLAHLVEIRGDEPWALAAVQALHPFYRRSDGGVVASWMTRVDRELAIDDNVGYLARAVASVREETGPLPLAYVGFSQGVAMAYRAAARSGFAARALVVLAGDVPPDVAALELPGFPRVLIGRGEGEEWYGEEKLAADVATLEGKGIEVDVCRFAGGHEWAPEVVARAREFLAAALRA